MKKWSVLLVVCVFIFYIIGIFLKLNMIFPLLVLFMIICLPIFLDSNEKGIRVIRGDYNSFLEVQMHETENKNRNYKTATISTPIICALIAVVLCFAHYMIFINKPKETLIHNPDYYVEYVYNYNTVRINVDQLSKDTITSIHIVNNNKDLMVNQPLKQYADDLNYKDVFPVLYHPGHDVETIVLNLYMKDFDNNSAKALLDYIGLTNELDDCKLTLSELKTSSSFKYKEIFKQGEYREHFYLELES